MSKIGKKVFQKLCKKRSKTLDKKNYLLYDKRGFEIRATGLG